MTHKDERVQAHLISTGLGQSIQIIQHFEGHLLCQYHHRRRQVLQHHARNAPIQVAHLVRRGLVQFLGDKLHLFGVVEAAVAGEQFDDVGGIEILLFQGVLVQFCEVSLCLEDLCIRKKRIHKVSK